MRLPGTHDLRVHVEHDVLGGTGALSGLIAALPAFSRVAGVGLQDRAVSASMPQTCRMRWRLS
jgi:hypothetical protein